MAVENYGWTATKSLFQGWLSATWLLFIGTIGVDVEKEFHGGSDVFVAFWGTSFFVVLLANGLFIQLPKKIMLRLCHSISYVAFVVVTAFYALLAFTVLVGWLFLAAKVLSAYLIFGAYAVIIGSIFGLTFYSACHKQSA